MKIKDITCFLVASITTIIIAVLSNIGALLNSDQAGFIGQTGFVLLQIVLVVKYFIVLLFLMPGRFVLKQVIYGFLLADIIVAAATAINKVPASFSACVIAGQIAFMCFYWFFERKRQVAVPVVTYSPFSFMMEDAA